MFLSYFQDFFVKVKLHNFKGLKFKDLTAKKNGGYLERKKPLPLYQNLSRTALKLHEKSIR